MLTERVEVRPMTADRLQTALEHLTETLAGESTGREGAWAREADRALAAVEMGLRQHVQAAEAADGSWSRVDLTRPTLVRRVSEVRQHHRALQDDLKTLRRDLRSAAEAFQRRHRLLRGADTLPPVQTPDSVPDFGAVRGHAESIADGLRRMEDEEVELLLESVNTDLGAGD